MPGRGLVDEEVSEESFSYEDHQAATSTETMSHEEYALLLVELHLEVMHILYN
jgi:hypothetical protein